MSDELSKAFENLKRRCLGLEHKNLINKWYLSNT